MNTPPEGDTRSILDRLRSRGIITDLTDPVAIGAVLTGMADAYAQVCAERDDLAAQLHAANPAHLSPKDPT